MTQTQALSRRRVLKAATGTAVLGMVGFPAITKAQVDTIKIGHLTPLTGFLGQLGVYGQNGAKMAVEEINARGGVLGRKLALITEDGVNPGVAVAKAQKLIEQDKVLVIIGEISSASAGAIMEQAKRPTAQRSPSTTGSSKASALASHPGRTSANGSAGLADGGSCHAYTQKQCQGCMRSVSLATAFLGAPIGGHNSELGPWEIPS